MAGGRPRHRVGGLESIGRCSPQLPRRAGHEIVDAVGPRVLKIVLVSAEHRPHPRPLPQGNQTVHALRVVMLRTGAVWRMMTEWDSPERSAAVLGKRELEKLPVLGVFEQPPPLEKIFFRRVDAAELDIRSIAESIEHPRTERRAPRRLFADNPFADIKIVLDLRAVVSLL